MHAPRFSRALALVLSLIVLIGFRNPSSAGVHPHLVRRSSISVARGRVEAISRYDSAVGWQIAVRVAPAGATSGVWLVGMAVGRSIVRDGEGRVLRLPGIHVGDSVTAWIHGAVMLSDPAVAFAESLTVAR